MKADSTAPDSLPRIIIVGGGFGGLAAARALKHADAKVGLIDKTNHHVFQPLLYQVATGVLSPEHIAAPLRRVLRKHANTIVLKETVIGVDAAKKVCIVEGVMEGAPVSLPYDYLVLATGVQHSYFDNDEYAPFAPGLKTIADADHLRNKILGAFENCERTLNPKAHPELLTFVIVGAGPTGVELAGAIAELAHLTLASEFRRFNPTSLRILLVGSAPRVLPPFHESLGAAVKARLEKMGVEVWTSARVEKVDADGVVIRGERIPTRNVFWAAGVTASPAAKWLEAETDKGGRVKVLPDCSVPGLPEVFVVGDTAAFETNGRSLPGVAQVAIQQGRYVGRLIAGRLRGESAPPPFKYFDKGNMATIGRTFAVMESGPLRMSGLFAKLAWAFVHVQFLVLPSNRFSTAFQWLRAMLTNQRLARLIIEPEASNAELHSPQTARERIAG